MKIKIEFGLVCRTPVLVKNLRRWLSRKEDLVVAWTATQSEEALSNLRESPVKLIVVDWDIRSSEELFRQFLHNSGKPKPNVVLLSSNPLTGRQADRLARLNVRSFISTPRDPSEAGLLTDAIFEVATGSTPLDPTVIPPQAMPMLRRVMPSFDRLSAVA